MYLFKTPWLLKKLYPSLIWDLKSKDKTIYLTFDDGPIPEVTEFVLEQLELYHSKATFFCVGENILKNSTVFEKVVNKGHAIGNHSYNHLNGFKSNIKTYIDNIKKCQDTIQEIHSVSQKLFRPPYGRITLQQIKEVKPEYKIIMWDVLSGDFDKTLTPQKCLKEIILHTKPGSIVVFHDSIKAYPILKYALPRYLQHFKDAGYSFKDLRCKTLDIIC